MGLPRIVYENKLINKKFIYTITVENSELYSSTKRSFSHKDYLDHVLAPGDPYQANFIALSHKWKDSGVYSELFGWRTKFFTSDKKIYTEILKEFKEHVKYRAMVAPKYQNTLRKQPNAVILNELPSKKYRYGFACWINDPRELDDMMTFIEENPSSFKYQDNLTCYNYMTEDIADLFLIRFSQNLSFLDEYIKESEIFNE